MSQCPLSGPESPELSFEHLEIKIKHGHGSGDIKIASKKIGDYNRKNLWNCKWKFVNYLQWGGHAQFKDLLVTKEKMVKSPRNMSKQWEASGRNISYSTITLKHIL